MFRRCLLVSVFLTLATAAHSCLGQDDFRPIVVVPKAFPAIKNADFVSATVADKVVRDEELVLGVEINGEARAYPINMLKGPSREIINDKLGGQHIAATW